MKTLFSLLAGKFTNSIIKEFDLGSGSTWPGHIALKINPEFIKDFLKTKKLKVVLVAGTNGKTTTTKLLRQILEKNNVSVFQNEEGANLVNGLATSILKEATIFGTIHADTALFEVDENNLPHVLKQITPDAIVFLNLFRDQLDRYGEVHTIAKKWENALTKLPNSTSIILNIDDPEIKNLASHIKGEIHYYSIPQNLLSKKQLSHDTDSTHCPVCNTKLKYSKIAYSHIGKYTCPKCSFTNEDITDNLYIETPEILEGIYNVYNISAACKTAQHIFNIPSDDISQSLEGFTPAFGRQEKIEYKKRSLLLLLSKNPAGLNQSLSVVLKDPQPTVLLALNDRIPDGKDVSWIWDTDTETLAKNAKSIIVTGDRAYDMALRIKYSFGNASEIQRKIVIHENTKDAIKELVKFTPPDKQGYILPTYSAMLEIRKILTGKGIL